MVWFFAGGETDDNKFNVFTGSFIRLLKEILNGDFELIKGIYFRSPMMNVKWALNNGQKAFINPYKVRFMDIAFRQVIERITPETQLILVSSSSGSVVVSQFACYLANKNRQNGYLKKPFHLALGACMISKQSELYRQIENFQKEGRIGKIIYDDLQDSGDTAVAICGKTRGEAWRNAFGLMFPFFSGRFSKPSFLNTHPVKGHIHRRRSQTVQKAIDYIEILLIKHKLAGDQYLEQAKSVIAKEKSRLLNHKIK
jgi:hypothetical protein